MTMLSNRIGDYWYISQGKTRIPGVNDGEDMEETDVSPAPRVSSSLGEIHIPSLLVRERSNVCAHVCAHVCARDPFFEGNLPNFLPASNDEREAVPELGRGFATPSPPACESCLPPQSGCGEIGGARRDSFLVLGNAPLSKMRRNWSPPFTRSPIRPTPRIRQAVTNAVQPRIINSAIKHATRRPGFARKSFVRRSGTSEDPDPRGRDSAHERRIDAATMFFVMIRRYVFIVQQHIRLLQRVPRKDHDPQRRRRRGMFTDGRKS